MIRSKALPGVRVIALIVAAIGINQRFYAPMAIWLATWDYVVAAFDHVGTPFANVMLPCRVA